MSRIHSTLIALVISAAATAGLYAAVASAQLGQASAAPKIPAHELASRQAKLAAWRHSLDAALAKRPPALPKLPHFAPVPAPPAPAAPVAVAAPSVPTAQPHVTYVRPPAVVKYEPAPPTATTTTTTSGDDEGDDGGDGGDDSGGGGD